MKLLNYTTSYFAVILLFLLTLWAVIFYIEMLDEIYDSMDDGLENQKLLVIQQAKLDSSILKKDVFGDGYYTIKETSFHEIANHQDSYRDTLMYMKNEKDYEPVRLLESSFKYEDKYYKVKIITSMVEEDDLIKELFFSLLWLYLGLIFTILILNNILHKKVWDPFYKLLARLGDFSIEKNKAIKFETTKIDEFRLLNERIEKLIQKSVESYNSQKQFIENASHELQTPLAISINKLELLAENGDFKEKELKELDAIMNNLERLTRFNKSLLLLSKIENKQFVNEEVVNLNLLAKQLTSQFEDLAAHKEIGIEIVENHVLQYPMNIDLASILLSNLIKNALVHGIAQSEIIIEIFDDRFKIRNSGNYSEELKPEEIFSRFQKSPDDRKSTGLGLAISKAITEKYGLNLTYSYKKEHIFEVYFPRK
ncbi:MAG TPA: HAMP domain-containing sensor histidine kinase [Salinimicrobium sp.]|nr:HAMP domain-containing sensor histidine kinase [Salinimicrobium sp.]